MTDATMIYCVRFRDDDGALSEAIFTKQSWADRFADGMRRHRRFVKLRAYRLSELMRAGDGATEAQG